MIFRHSGGYRTPRWPQPITTNKQKSFGRKDLVGGFRTPYFAVSKTCLSQSCTLSSRPIKILWSHGVLSVYWNTVLHNEPAESRSTMVAIRLLISNEINNIIYILYIKVVTSIYYFDSALASKISLTVQYLNFHSLQVVDQVSIKAGICRTALDATQSLSVVIMDLLLVLPVLPDMKLIALGRAAVSSHWLWQFCLRIVHFRSTLKPHPRSRTTTAKCTITNTTHNSS